MPERERAFMVMHYHEGRGLTVIAEKLGRSTKWCDKVKRQALDQLLAAG